jgi:hypothetical protein
MMLKIGLRAVNCVLYASLELSSKKLMRKIERKIERHFPYFACFAYSRK